MGCGFEEKGGSLLENMNWGAGLEYFVMFEIFHVK